MKCRKQGVGCMGVGCEVQGAIAECKVKGARCPNFTKNFEKQMFQITNHSLSCMILLGGLSVSF